MTKNIFLNGPYNYLKLINGDKNIYIFFDWHSELFYQKKCEETYSVDIDKYLFEILKNNKNIDFFFEINPTSIEMPINKNINSKYIHEINKKFRKMYKELQTLEIKDVRLHYIDIRDYILFNSIHDSLRFFIMNFNTINSFQISRLGEILNNIIKNLTLIISLIDSIRSGKEFIIPKINIIKKEIENKDLTLSPEHINEIGAYKLLEKVLIKYTNKNNEKIINDLINEKFLKPLNETIERFKKLLSNVNELKPLVDYYEDNWKVVITEKNDIINDSQITLNSIPDSIRIQQEIYKELNNLINILLAIFSIPMDAYFLRRFLEKDYINNAIIYTGGAHSNLYVWFLIKYCNFKIEEYDTINNIESKELEKIIKESNNDTILNKYLIPEYFKQCINLKEEINFNKKIKN